VPDKRKSAMRAGAIFLACLVSAFTTSMSQETQTQIKKVSAPTASAASGQQTYMVYCAVCHGTDGKGGGPATPALKDQVPDLTTLALRYNGKYPASYVSSILRFGVQGNPAHGSPDMPIWGPIFRDMGTTRKDKSSETTGIANLNRYLESLQVK
jgi:mono/diheme cytochrome c family protein